MAEQELIHYYDFDTCQTACGKSANKNSNWVVNYDLVTCPDCLDIIKGKDNGR